MFQSIDLFWLIYRLMNGWIDWLIDWFVCVWLCISCVQVYIQSTQVKMSYIWWCKKLLGAIKEKNQILCKKKLTNFLYSNNFFVFFFFLVSYTCWHTRYYSNRWWCLQLCLLLFVCYCRCRKIFLFHIYIVFIIEHQIGK